MNSFIIAGPKGLGKVGFVLNLSKYLLCELENNKSINISNLKNTNFTHNNVKTNKSFYLFDNQSHPDFFYLKNDKDNEGKKIPIENVRKLKDAKRSMEQNIKNRKFNSEESRTSL